MARNGRGSVRRAGRDRFRGSRTGRHARASHGVLVRQHGARGGDRSQARGGDVHGHRVPARNVSRVEQRRDGLRRQAAHARALRRGASLAHAQAVRRRGQGRFHEGVHATTVRVRLRGRNRGE